ncbi:excisionase family DNA binding protein [Evansella vedderi]|uniref:Excisionase family DNA binding protein n=1 Tax=Evansella vedderi TaxID=38282 RepID=A0ABU0A597_9BACI|nr:helix-turn-helix domain-containing protein [Evansella vedderi]MDQ0257515.1 excisionase family DNA binding protein [Evansella vedderi]
MQSLKDFPDVLTVKDVKRFLGIGQVQAYQLVHSQKFRIVRVGTRILISKQSFESWFEGNSVK